MYNFKLQFGKIKNSQPNLYIYNHIFKNILQRYFYRNS